MAATKTVASWILTGIVVVTGSACSSSKTSTPTSTGDAGGGGGGGGGGSGEGGTPKEPPTGWRAAVGTLGTLVQTFDEKSWETRTVGTHDLEAVACVGNLVGWATGTEGLVMHTEDGGRTWSAQDPGLARPLHAIRFGRLDLGVVAGDRGGLAVTRDAGASWATITTAPAVASALRGVAVAGAARLAIVVGDGGAILRSTDDGTTFQVMTGLTGTDDLQAVAADPGAHLILAVSTSGAIWASTDRGASFHREATAPRALHAVALHESGTRALAAGDDGTVLERAASGAWSPIASGTHEVLRAALVPDDGSTDYVAGNRGTLLARPAGAAALVPIASGTTADLFALEDL